MIQVPGCSTLKLSDAKSEDQQIHLDGETWWWFHGENFWEYFPDFSENQQKDIIYAMTQKRYNAVCEKASNDQVAMIAQVIERCGKKLLPLGSQEQTTDREKSIDPTCKPVVETVVTIAQQTSVFKLPMVRSSDGKKKIEDSPVADSPKISIDAQALGFSAKPVAPSIKKHRPIAKIRGFVGKKE